MSERKGALNVEHQRNVAAETRRSHRFSDQTEVSNSKRAEELQHVEEELVNIGQQRYEAPKLGGPSGWRSFTWFFHEDQRNIRSQKEKQRRPPRSSAPDRVCVCVCVLSGFNRQLSWKLNKSLFHWPQTHVHTLHMRSGATVS